MSAAPAAVVPFDLEAAAKAVEAESAPFPFTWHGESYELPPQTEWPVSALRALATGDLETAFSQLLGGAAFDVLTAHGLTVGAMNLLFDEAAKASGLGGSPNSKPQRRRASTRT